MILAEGVPTGIGLLIPQIPEIIYTLVFLVIFALVFMKYILPRMNAVLDERASRIEGGLHRAEEAQAEADRLRAEHEDQLAAARQESAAMREQARQDGEKIVVEARQRAEAESDRILAQGRQQLAAERQAAAAQLRGEVGTLASQLAEKIVGEALSDDERSARVIDRFLADLESSENTPTH